KRIRMIINRKMDSYKKLKFWQKSREVNLKIVKLIKTLPSEKIVWIITDQIIRSSFSVGANIAEGFGRYKGKEYARFIQIALGSARETEYWLELLQDIYPKFSKQIDSILMVNTETIKMLVTTLNSLRKRKS
ncbi:four helix bundle protein, partial [Patescibacteria group bacterium]|nr:four helix bundle protein [Patescibacteria group bacterium]